MKGWIGAALLVLLGVLAASAQEEWLVADAQNAAELFQTEIRNLSLSPDGTMIAASGEGQICVLTLETGDEECFSTEGNFQTPLAYTELQNPLVWSPDSARLLFTENLYLFFNEPDLWTLDITTGEFSNLTDDGVVGGAMFRSDNAAYTIDYLPTFAPNGDIYFFRAIPGKEGSDFDLTLQRLPAGADEPEAVTGSLSSYPIIWADIFYSPSISPDGSMLAFPVADPDRSAPQNGLWLLDLESGDARHLVNTRDMHAGMPKHQQELEMTAANPVWVLDGEGIIFRTIGFEANAVVGTYLYVDVETGNVRPVVNLSGIADFNEILEANAPELLLVPQDGTVSADGSTFISLGTNADRTTAQLVRVPLPPDGSDPEVLGQFDFGMSLRAAVPNPMMSADNKALLGGGLFTFE